MFDSILFLVKCVIGFSMAAFFPLKPIVIVLSKPLALGVA
jgi:hypothetical protein